MGKVRRTHPETGRWLGPLTGRTIVIATQSRAEVLAGILIRDLGEARSTAILGQLDATPTIPVDERLVQRFAALTADARARGDALGQPQHTGDRWVAATALAIGASLLAIDHIYDNDPGLSLLGSPRPK